MRLGFSIPAAKAALVAALLVVAPTVANAEPSGKYYERSFVLAAHDHCDLFQPDVVAALEASTLQARGAAIRAGTSEADLAAAAGRARGRAAATRCGDPQLKVVRDRVETAFSGWSRTPRMTFPGQSATWSADRSAVSGPGWRLMQASVTGGSPVTFGFKTAADGRETLGAVVSFVGRPRPYAARIVMRDPGLAARPWLTASGAAALPPEAARRVFWSAGSAAADKALLEAGQSQGQAWTFPTASADALARLDPREPFVVEFLFRDGSATTARFEAGDFAAGRAFLAMGSL